MIFTMAVTTAMIFTYVASTFANQSFDWIQQTLYVQYAADDVTEASRIETNLDDEGRQTGYRTYSNGTLSSQGRDYQLNGRTNTYWMDVYSGGNISSSNKYQMTYSDKNWIQMTRYVQYAADGATEVYRSETDLDDDGKQTGYRTYSNGTLSSQRRNYQYNGRTVTYWQDRYTTIDISHLPSGTYLVRIVTAKGVVTERVLKE